MAVITGEAATTDAPRIIKRLCNHWGHKLTVRMDGTTGVIEFPAALVTLRAMPDRIGATIEGADPAEPRRLTSVVAVHLQRMAGDAELAMSWSDSA